MNDPIKIIFFGTPDFSVPTLKALLDDERFCVTTVVTQPDRPSGRGFEVRPSPVKRSISNSKITILQPDNIRKDLSNFLDDTRALGAFDVGIIIAFGQILPQAVLDLPKHGCINLHASLLPHWRGAAPIQRALMAGENLSGICLMRMEAGLDTGPVYSKLEVSILESDNFETLHNRLAQAAAEITIRDLCKIISGELKATAQDNSKATYANKISNAEAQIDWKQSATSISNLCRALNPVPGAFTLMAGKRLKIFECLPLDENIQDSTMRAGEIISVDKNYFEVACGKGRLRILGVQAEGKKRMFSGPFLKGFPMTKSMLLGK